MGTRSASCGARRWWSTCGRRGAVPAGRRRTLLAAAHRTFGDRIRFIGVDILDERRSARGFKREYGWTYPSVYHPSGAIRDGLGLLGQPVTLFYDASGELVDTWTGPLSEEALGSASRPSSNADRYAGGCSTIDVPRRVTRRRRQPELGQLVRWLGWLRLAMTRKWSWSTPSRIRRCPSPGQTWVHELPGDVRY